MQGTAQAYIEREILDAVLATLASCAPTLRPLLTQVIALDALSRVTDRLEWYLLEGLLSVDAARQVRRSHVFWVCFVFLFFGCVFFVTVELQSLLCAQNHCRRLLEAVTDLVDKPSSLDFGRLDLANALFAVGIATMFLVSAWTRVIL